MLAFGPPQKVLHPDLLAEVYEGRIRAFADLPGKGKKKDPANEPENGPENGNGKNRNLPPAGGAR